MEMVTVPGVSPWKLKIRREPEGIVIVRAQTCAAEAILPDTLFDQPVVKLDSRAVSVYAWEPEGEEIELSCGQETPGGKWDNRRLRALTLPEELRTVGNHAFQGCAALETLTLRDAPIQWGGCAILGCDALCRIFLHRDSHEDWGCMAYFADEIKRELEITAIGPGTERFRLFFPEYSEVEEVFMSDHLDFHYQLSGAGYQYHHAFLGNKLKFSNYDRCWESFLSMGHEPEAAARIAHNRLRWPVELAPRSAELYRTYLQAHAADALPMALEENDTEGLRFLLLQGEVDRETLRDLCDAAREKNATGAHALLLEELHRRFGAVGRKTFEL